MVLWLQSETTNSSYAKGNLSVITTEDREINKKTTKKHG